MDPVAWSVVFVAGWVDAESAGPLVVAESALFSVLGLARRDGQILLVGWWGPDSPGRPPGVSTWESACSVVLVVRSVL